MDPKAAATSGEPLIGAVDIGGTKIAAGLLSARFWRGAK